MPHHAILSAWSLKVVRGMACIQWRHAPLGLAFFQGNEECLVKLTHV